LHIDTIKVKTRDFRLSLSSGLRHRIATTAYVAQLAIGAVRAAVPFVASLFQLLENQKITVAPSGKSVI
jgi:hypothetical protein